MTYADVDGSELRRCPTAQLMDDGMCGIVTWSDRYEQHVYPVAGGVLNQSAMYLDAMEVVESARAGGRYKG